MSTNFTLKPIVFNENEKDLKSYRKKKQKETKSFQKKYTSTYFYVSNITSNFYSISIKIELFQYKKKSEIL